MTETWFTAGDLSPFSDLVPSNCTFINCPMTTGKGGGIAFKSRFGCSPVLKYNDLSELGQKSGNCCCISSIEIK